MHTLSSRNVFCTQSTKLTMIALVSFPDPSRKVEKGSGNRVGQIMLNFSPIMLFQYAQNSTNYALDYDPYLPIMLELCPLFLEGANLSAKISALLCCVQHHNFITNLKPVLGAYWEIYTSRLHGLSCEDSITGSGRSCKGRDTSQSETGTQGLDTCTV